jgi:hypothetical protein
VDINRTQAAILALVAGSTVSVTALATTLPDAPGPTPAELSVVAGNPTDAPTSDHLRDFDHGHDSDESSDDSPDD